MAIRLGELLIHNKLLTQEQLDEALQAQVIFGGKLGTILIEMGMISETLLAKALSKLMKIPCVKPGELQNIPADIIGILNADLAEKYQAIPMALSGKNLTLAMASPHDLKAIDDISFRTGYIVRPVLGLEVRLVHALERYYDIKRSMRYIAPPSLVRYELDQLEKKKKKPPKEDEEYLGAPGSEQVYAPQPEQGPAVEKPYEQEEIEAPQEEKKTEEVEELDEEVEELSEEAVSLEDTSLQLVEVRDRDDVADALIRYLAANYYRAALFMVVGGQITGWRSARDGEPIAGFDAFQLPASEPSVLKTTIDNQSYFLGPLPKSGANLALISHLGKPDPTTILLLPLALMGRVVGLIYIDDPETNLAEHLPDLQMLATKGLMAFELLILHNKILRN